MFKSKLHLEMIDPSSKMTLKISCLRACDNDVNKAKELYDFLSADVADIPDFEPVNPGTFEQVKRGASDIFGWLTSHKEDITQGVTFIQSLRNTGAATAAPVEIPPIPKL